MLFLNQPFYTRMTQKLPYFFYYQPQYLRKENEYLNILSAEHGVDLKEYDDEEMNKVEPDVSYAVGANLSGGGGA